MRRLSPARAIGHAAPPRAHRTTDALRGTATVTPPAALAAGAVGTATFAVNGAQDGDLARVSFRGQIHADLLVQDAWVSAPNVVTVSLRNVGVGAVTDSQRTVYYEVSRAGS